MPDWKGIVRQRLSALKLEGSQQSEVFDELAQHLEDRYEELIAAGYAPGDAERIAIEPLHTSPSLVEALSRARNPRKPEPPARPNHIANLLYDARIALRGMRQKPAFSLMVVGMLALGIASNAAIFSTFNSLFLKPLPFRDSARLIDLDETAPQWNLHYVGIAENDLFAWKDQNTTFDGMAFFTGMDTNLSRMGPARHVDGAKVTRDMLAVLDLKPVLGRNFTPDEDKPKGEKVVLLGYSLWQELYSGDRGVLGRTLVLDDEPYKIVGVQPREAVFPDRAELWVPQAANKDSGDGWYLHGVGRLKAGVTPQQALADLTRIHKAMIAGGRSVNKITSPILTPMRERYLGDFQTTSQVLLVAVAVVLLIACVNIAALMLVRASSRAHEVAVRAAIGASRGRIIRQLLTETALLALMGGVAGVLLGRLGLSAIVSLLPDTMPRWIDFHLDLRFAAFCVLLTAASALLFGLFPALQASRTEVSGTLHVSSRRATFSRAQKGTLNVLVVSEIGLAMALLVASGLLVRAFHKVTHIDPGFRVDNVLAFEIDLPEQKYKKPEQCVELYSRMLEQLRALPGVVAAGGATTPPLHGHWGQFFTAQDDPPPGPNEKSPVVLQVLVTPGYFDAIGMTTLAGRQFDDHDGTIKEHPVAMVNETFVRQHWPHASAIGKAIRYSYDDKGRWWEVVGVLRNTKHYGLDGEERPAVYIPEKQWPYPRSLMLVAHTTSNPEALTGPARKILASIDPDLPLYNVHTMSERLDRSLWARRAYSWLFGIFSLVALVLAAAGIYGVISYAVSQRTHEIGIRMAVGATPAEVLANIMRSGLVLVAAGAAIGVAVALAAGSLLEKLLFGVSPRDPLVYGAVVLAVAAVGLLANAIPARRAAALDPVKALRTE